MHFRNVSATLIACALSISFSLRAAELHGVVLDPSRKPVAGAQVAAINRVGVVAEQVTDAAGKFAMQAPDGVDLRVAAPGFATKTVPGTEVSIELALAPVADSIHVTGSAIDAPAGLQGGSVTVITSGEIRERNEAVASELLREVPGLVIAQSGGAGTVMSLFARGGESKYNLVQLNGIPVSSFYYGGLFDFAHLTSDSLQEIDVARGPQSAVYGSYAISSAVNFVTRNPSEGLALDVIAEGGTHTSQRYALNGSGTLAGWGISAAASHYSNGGAVRNSDYTNQGLYLAVDRHWNKQRLFAFGDYDWNEVGEPGPYGSNPRHYFSGIDLVSRSRNYSSTYGAHYQADITDRFRQDIFAGFYLNNSPYKSAYGTSFNKDLRLTGEARETFSVSRHWIMAGGFVYEREEDRNTYITSNLGSVLLRRSNQGLYWENRFEFRNKLFVNAGVRGEIFENPFVPGYKNGYPPRPDFPAATYSQTSPKISAVYFVKPETRLHTSFGTGIRPPGGSDLAFTNNPALKPEHSLSYEFGVEQRLAGDKIALDATWFHNRYKDLIVSLGGSLAKLSQYSTDNLNNARTEGVETSVRVRPARWLSATGSYTWLQAQVLGLNGTGLAQSYYTPGQLLARRPRQSGSMVITAHKGRFDVNLTGYFRGQTLDVEPSYGASGGFYVNPGYQNIGLNVNYHLRSNLTAYVNLRNALNQRYEEIYGYPAPLLSAVVGVKWDLGRSK